MWMPGPTELAIVGVVAAVIFGPKQLPKIAKGWGEALRELRKGRADIEEALEPDAPERRKL